MKAFFISLTALISLAGAGFGLYSCVSGIKTMFSNDHKPKILSYEREGSQYLYYRSSAEMLESMLSSKQYPSPSFMSLKVHKEDGLFYIFPEDIKVFVGLLTKKVNFFEYDYNGSQGFFTTTHETKGLIEQSLENKPTGEIGKVRKIQNLKLHHPRNKKKPLVIQIEMGSKPVAIKNSVIKEIPVITSPFPGKTTLSYKPKALIGFRVLRDYFNPQGSLSLSEDQDVLVYSTK